MIRLSDVELFDFRSLYKVWVTRLLLETDHAKFREDVICDFNADPQIPNFQFPIPVADKGERSTQNISLLPRKASGFGVLYTPQPQQQFPISPQ